LKTLFAFFMAAVLAVPGLVAQEKQRMFMGSDKCKPCHMSPKKGAQYKVWKETKHAKAFETLASDKAKEIGAKKGIKNPQEDGACLKCHIDAFGVDQKLLGEKYNKADGVGCESCHGAGGDYWAKEVMADIRSKKIDGATVGLVKPNEAACKKCHNEESPSFTGFNFEEMVKKIAHPMPKEEGKGG
jgi:hypothetical protein